eukprot:TRINITY_DN1990_c0_g1_i1.p1 TRINITY_DN1990_c0_g1~~TRINITY_DN1990_c0_g1_i1.p1  ORF type:complete len:196 (-),score=25.53 TRINITY_DN1990_c0_g1_i1:124-711(-)
MFNTGFRRCKRNRRSHRWRPTASYRSKGMIKEYTKWKIADNVVVITGMGLLITSMVSLYQGLMTNRTWTEIEATVTVAKKLRITESKSILYDLQYEYQDPLLLEYMDEYDDEIITGTTYRIGQPLPFSYIYHNEIQVGDKIVAYYNPSYRSQSTVKTGMSKVGFICVGVAFTFLILPSMARLKVSPAEARKIMNS